jgi:hypothetical protein
MKERLNLIIVGPTRINGLYMFRALFAHHRGALNLQQLEYFVRIMSAGCYQP